MFHKLYSPIDGYLDYLQCGSTLNKTSIAPIYKFSEAVCLYSSWNRNCQVIGCVYIKNCMKVANSYPK